MSSDKPVDIFYQKGTLKLKNKTKKSKLKNKDIEKATNELPKVVPHMKTKAEKVFEERQLSKLNERAGDKAKKTHRQRVEEFNSYLDTLSEYYDIQKVSWTK